MTTKLNFLEKTNCILDWAKKLKRNAFSYYFECLVILKILNLIIMVENLAGKIKVSLLLD